VKWLYAHQHPASPPTPSPNPIDPVCIADTHSQQPNLPHSGDILINAGDLTNNGTFEESQSQLTWLNTLPHPHKIVIAGNHDLLLDKTFHAVHKIPELKASEVSGLYWGFIRYLEHSLTTVNVKARSVRIYGAPHTPKYGNSAFQYPRSSSPKSDVWRNTISENTDVVVTHGPALGHVDGKRAGNLGCAHLLQELWSMKPKVHVCGHIHQAQGLERVDWGLVQRGCDGVCSGKGKWTGVCGCLCCSWRGYGCGFHTGSLDRKGGMKITFLNAALMGRKRFVGGERAAVVET
jgi:predicted phosphodiesterase